MASALPCASRRASSSVLARTTGERTGCTIPRTAARPRDKGGGDDDHNGESPGYGVLLGLPDWSMLVALHHHPLNGGETFSETRTGMDHVGFKVADRAELEAWEARLADLGVKHSPIAHRAATR